MKKLYFILFFLQISNVFGQITKNPDIEQPSHQGADITKVELTEKYTIVSMVYYEKGQRRLLQTPYGPRLVMEAHTISIDPKSFLRANGKKHKFIKADGIPLLPNETTIEVGEKLRFTAYYERIERGIETFDFVEGKNTEGDTRHYWNFYGVHITNPLNSVHSDTPAEKKFNAAVQLVIKGVLYDAQTKKPITGNVRYEVENSEVKINQSSSTTTSGEYSFNLSPKSFTITATSEGYETQQESLDLSKIARNQQFIQNFYLNQLPKKVEPKKIEPSKEIAKEETPKREETVLLPRETNTPTKVEENKFRLDRVYFPLGESMLLPASFEQLDGLLSMMKEQPKMKIIVEGHTDNVGDATQNKRLSLERAYNVREYLVGKGISGNRIQFKGYGDTKPLTSNDTEEGRQQNRRVEFVIQ